MEDENFEKLAEEIEVENKKINGELLTPENLKSVFEKNPKKGIDEIAKYLTEKYHFITLAGRTNDEVYLFDAGVYRPNKAIKLIKQEVEMILGELCSAHYIFEITEKLKRITYFDGVKEEFGNQNLNLICVENGILDIETLELKPHDPKEVFLSKIPVEFNGVAGCSKIKEFFNDTLLSEDVAVMQEWFGFCLFRQYFLKKAIILVGNPHGGKTQMVELLKHFLGGENISGESLQQLSSNRFSIISLYGKLANVFDDLDFSDVEHNGTFKMATGGSTLTGEMKFGDRFQFNNYAKLIFTCNKIPKTKEIDDDAYYDRWIILRFENCFDENNPKRDPFILDKITIKEELSGLLNWALEGLKKIIQLKKFSYSKTLDDVIKFMQKSGSALAGFTQECLVDKEGGFLSKDELYNSYCDYVKEKNLTRDTKEYVGRQLGKFANYIKDTEQRKAGKKTQGWANVSLKSTKNSENLTEEEDYYLKLANQEKIDTSQQNSI